MLPQRTVTTTGRGTRYPARKPTTSRSPTPTPTTPPFPAPKRANRCPQKAPFSFSPRRTGDSSRIRKIIFFSFHFFFSAKILSALVIVWARVRRGWRTVWARGGRHGQGQEDGLGVAPEQDRPHPGGLRVLHFCPRQLVNSSSLLSWAVPAVTWRQWLTSCCRSVTLEASPCPASCYKSELPELDSRFPVWSGSYLLALPRFARLCKEMIRIFFFEK
jgi:hypothetical protein